MTFVTYDLCSLLQVTFGQRMPPPVRLVPGVSVEESDPVGDRESGRRLPPMSALTARPGLGPRKISFSKLAVAVLNFENKRKRAVSRVG